MSFAAPEGRAAGTAFLPLVFIALVAAGLYGRAIGFGYTGYDDQQLVVGLHAYLAEARNLVATFFHDGFGQLSPESQGLFYRPVLLDTYIVDTVAFGGSPPAYHATNVVLHGVASLGVYLLLTALGQARGLALFLALVFCVHPVSVSVPAWLPCRNESLLAIAVLAAALSLLRCLRGEGLRWLPAVWLALAVALFSKETGVALAAVLSLVVLLERREDEGLFSVRLVILGAGSVLVGAVWFAMRQRALGDFPVLLSDMAANATMLVVYAGKALFPIGLSVYPHPRDVSLVPGCVALAVFAATLVASRRQLWGRAGLGLGWALAFLAPTLGGPAETAGLEHRLYLPLVGLLIVAGTVLAGIRERLPRAWALVLAVSVVGLYAGTSAARLGDFSDESRFWASAVRTSPSAERAWQYRATTTLSSEQYVEAERACRQLTSRRPEHAPGFVLLAQALAGQGRLDEAESAQRRAARLDPGRARNWEDLADLQRRRGRDEAAAESERRASRAREDR